MRDSPPPFGALQRHRFLLGSLGLHACLLWGLAQWQGGASAKVEERLIQTSTQAAERHGMRRRVDSLKAMKELVDRIDRAQNGRDPAQNSAAAPEVRKTDAARASGQATDPQPTPTPQEMLAQARELRDSIQKMEQQTLAKALAEGLNISEQEALARLQQQPVEGGKTEGADKADLNSTDEQVSQTLERYERESRASVQRMQQQLERQKNGTQVTTSSGRSGATAATRGPKSTHELAGGQPGKGEGQGGSPSLGRAGGIADGRQSDVMDLEPRRYDGPLRPLPVDTASLRLGKGNVIGDGGAFSNRVFVNQWYVIGPFHAPDPSNINKVYPPELLVDLDAVYLGKGQRALRWQYVNSASYPLIPPVEAEQAMYYGYTEIRSDRSRDVWMAFGADDDAKAWVNDQLVWVSGNQKKFWYTQGGFRSRAADIQFANLIETRRLVHLRKGRNTVLFKLYNNPLDVFFTLVLEPAAGSP